MARVLIGLGANTPEKHTTLQRTIQAIDEIWHIVAQTPIYDTPAEGSVASAPYANALVVAIIDLEYETLRRQFKQWELDAGRTPEHKKSGIVPLDIDIVMWNDAVLKERDMQMNFMKKGLELLNIPSNTL